MDALYTQLADKARGTQPPPVDRVVRCWMTFLWRAIAANGITMMHSHLMRQQRVRAWRLLAVRVWAAAVECARFVSPATHSDLYMAVMSGRPLIMPGWAARGMPVPFIFDVAYGWRETVPGSCFVHYTCLQALNCETTLDNAFIVGDDFLAALIGRKGDLVLHPLWQQAFTDYKEQVQSLQNGAQIMLDTLVPEPWPEHQAGWQPLLYEAWTLFRGKVDADPPAQMLWYTLEVN